MSLALNTADAKSTDLGSGIRVRVLKAASGDAAADPNRSEASLLHGDLLQPEYSASELLAIVKMTGLVRPSISAFETNVDAFGHRFEPRIDVDSDDGEEKIRDLLAKERYRSPSPTDDFEEPTQQQVDERLRQLRRAISLERDVLSDHFEFACAEQSFVDLRRLTRFDLEATGNAYWEIIRNADGKPEQYVLLAVESMRLTRYGDPVDVEQKIVTSDMRIESRPRKRRFRRFAQVRAGDAAPATWFKEFGDPRTISRATGKAYEDVDAMLTAEPVGVAANEVLHFHLQRFGEAYGTPRWLGNHYDILGSNDASKVNRDYFKRKGVPPLALLISGGAKMDEDTVGKLERYIADNLHGTDNFHKILIIEASSDGSDDAAPTIELKPLTDAQQKDGLFLNYDERSMDKVGMSYRLPRLLRGDVRDFNRATANAALRFTEQQVFKPERNTFDHMINSRILPELEVKHHRFMSNGASARDLEAIADALPGISPFVRPLEVRPVIAEALGIHLPSVDEEWAKQPIEITLAGKAAGEPDDGEGDLPTLAGQLRARLTTEEARRARSRATSDDPEALDDEADPPEEEAEDDDSDAA